MRLARVRPGVYVAVARTDDLLARRQDHRDDEARVAGLPGWRAAEHLAGRALLRRLLRRVAPAAAELPVRPDDRGRPQLPGSRVGVSVSHDGGTVAACAGIGLDVGVDVQTPPADVDDRLLQRCLRAAAGELTGLTPAERSLAFSWVWTVQEACVKADGLGLAGRPWAIDVRPGARSGRWGRYEWRSLPGLSPIPLSCAFAPRSGT